MHNYLNNLAEKEKNSLTLILNKQAKTFYSQKVIIRAEHTQGYIPNNQKQRIGSWHATHHIGNRTKGC